MGIFEPEPHNAFHPKKLIMLGVEDYERIYERPFDGENDRGYMCMQCDQWFQTIYSVAENKEEARWHIDMDNRCGSCMIQVLLKTGANIKFEHETARTG